VRTVKLFRPQEPVFDTQFTISKANYAAFGITPHSGTVRLSITIPAGNRGEIRHGFIFLMRDGSATTAGTVRSTMEIAGWGVIAEVREIQAQVGLPRELVLPMGFILESGETLIMTTGDGSIDGSYGYALSAEVVIGPLT
jgi:hypothetical protein